MAPKYNQYSGQDLKTKHIEVIWIVAGIFFSLSNFGHQKAETLSL